MNNRSLLVATTIMILVITSCGAPPPTLQDSDQAEILPTVTEEVKISPTSTEEVRISTASEEVSAVFDVSTANQTVPDGILKEISFFGGGGRFHCDPSQPPYILQEPEDGELITLSTMISCGWQDNEILKASILYPDGRSKVFDLQTEDDGLGNYYGQFGYKTAIGDPPGKYTLILQGKNGTVESDVHFTEPDRPSIVRPDDDHIYLYGFAPDERVRLYHYSEAGELDGWAEYKMSPSGELLINIGVETGPYFTYFYAIGDTSGETRLLQENPFGETVDRTQQKSIQVLYCGSLQTRLSIGATGWVAYTDGAEMRVRKYAGLETEILYKVPEGTIFTITDGPKCLDEITWWKTHTENDLEGWMAEEHDGVYFLEPYP